MDCACLFLEICGYYYYKKGVYAQVIRSTLDDAFESGNTVPHECMHPKNKKNARNRGNLLKRTSELHETAINSKKR